MKRASPLQTLQRISAGASATEVSYAGIRPDSSSIDIVVVACAGFRRWRRGPPPDEGHLWQQPIVHAQAFGPAGNRGSRVSGTIDLDFAVAELAAASQTWKKAPGDRRSCAAGCRRWILPARAWLNKALGVAELAKPVPGLQLYKTKVVCLSPQNKICVG